MRSFDRSILHCVPVAVWILLLMALFSFGVFHYKQSLQMAVFRRIAPLEEIIREVGYHLSRGYLHLEKYAAGDPGVSTDDVFPFIKQARSGVRIAMVRLRGADRPPTLKGGQPETDLHDSMVNLEAVIQIFLDVAYRRLDAPEDSATLLRRQQHKLYKEAEEIMAEVANQLEGRSRLLENRQHQVNAVLTLAWMIFAIAMCLVIVQAERNSGRWERALARSEARLRSILSVFPDPVLLVDSEGTIVDLPSSGDELLAGMAEGLKGQSVARLVGDEKVETAIETINQAIATGRATSFSYVQTVDRRKRFFEARIVAIQVGDDSASPTVLWLAHDLTQFNESQERRIELERRIQQAQKLESLGVMAGGIAHDFDNLLTGVIGHAEVALSEIPDDSPVRESLAEIYKSAGKAAELALQMLKYSGNTHMAFATVDLWALVQVVDEELKPGLPESVALTTECVGKGAEFDGDYEQIRQIVRNLVLNAVEAAVAAGGGSIDVHVGIKHCTQDDLQGNYLKESHPPGDYAYVRVNDTGCGIPAEDYQRLFDPFFTTKFTGRGLGLAAVQGIVKSHEGIIKVKSFPGVGTSFEILFPVSKRDSSSEEYVDFSGVL